MKKYFSKDWKFFIRMDSVIGQWYGVFINRMGMKLLSIGRKLIGKGGGTFNGKYYQNCSWCGDTQGSGGLHMSASRKGMRCERQTPVCGKRP